NKGQDIFKSEEFIDGQVHENEWRSRNNGNDMHGGIVSYNRDKFSDFHVGLHTRTAGNIFVMFHF
ncbi:MAG: hypothetical protein LBR55_03840, partial [Bacteroidales bacterium]|nr:hypothetical protein [Bacteroidales bacterium]